MYCRNIIIRHVPRPRLKAFASVKGIKNINTDANCLIISSEYLFG